MSLSIKITFGDDIRRFSVSREISFPELKAFIEKHLGVSHLMIKYTDDEEELVTIGSTIELDEAKRLQPDVLRLTVSETKSSTRIVVPVTEEKKAALLNACLVRDVTMADGSQVTVNTPFKKIWRLKNNGEVDWPDNVKLSLIGPEDYQLGGTLAGVTVRPVKVGQEIDVGIDLQAPKVAGRYVGFWKLMSGSEPFGQRIWVDVNVVASKADEEEEKRKAEAERIRKAEQERIEAERKREEEEMRQREEEEERRRREEEERLRREEEKRLKREEEEEEERRIREEEERLRREEEERLRREEEEEEERLRREEDERLRREEEERRRQEEEERLRREEEERRSREEQVRMEEERYRREVEERRRREEEERLRKEAEEKMKREMEEKRKEEERRKAEEAKKAEEEALLAKLPFANEIKQLADMGFTDLKKNRELLTRYNGNVAEVCEALLMGV